MTSKVFLFDKGGWSYCSDVRLKDGVYSGWVVNGAWYLVYDTKTKVLDSYRDAGEKRNGYVPVTSWTVELTWMCYPYKALFDYNSIIEDAKKRYNKGEEANYSLKAIAKETKDEDEVPF